MTRVATVRFTLSSFRFFYRGAVTMFLNPVFRMCCFLFILISALHPAVELCVAVEDPAVTECPVGPSGVCDRHHTLSFQPQLSSYSNAGSPSTSDYQLYPSHETLLQNGGANLSPIHNRSLTEFPFSELPYTTRTFVVGESDDATLRTRDAENAEYGDSTYANPSGESTSRLSYAARVGLTDTAVLEMDNDSPGATYFAEQYKTIERRSPLHYAELPRVASPFNEIPTILPSEIEYDHSRSYGWHRPPVTHGDLEDGLHATPYASVFAEDSVSTRNRVASISGSIASAATTPSPFLNQCPWDDEDCDWPLSLRDPQYSASNARDATCRWDASTCGYEPDNWKIGLRNIRTPDSSLMHSEPVWRRKGEDPTTRDRTFRNHKPYATGQTGSPEEDLQHGQEGAESSADDTKLEEDDKPTTHYTTFWHSDTPLNRQNERRAQDILPEESSGVIPEAFLRAVSMDTDDDIVDGQSSDTLPLSVHYDFYDADEIEPVATSMLGNGGKPLPAKGVFVYCYPFNEEQIVEKCAGAKDMNGVGVYIPMMMEVQIKHDKTWYARIRQLKQTSGLGVIGIAYENPNWKLITEILLENPRTFAGVLIEWIGDLACISKMHVPTVQQLEAIKEATEYGIIRYFVREQNFSICETTMPEFVRPTRYIPLSKIKNVTEEYGEALTQPKGFEFPPYIQPVFGCMGGQEGLCYKAFRQNGEKACSSHQRYIFNPYEYAGGRMLHMFNESCRGLPLLDLYGTL